MISTKKDNPRAISTLLVRAKQCLGAYALYLDEYDKGPNYWGRDK